MRKYYTLSIIGECEHAMLNLAEYYKMRKRYREMVNLYTIAVKFKNYKAIDYLIYHYSKFNSTDPNIIKYCLLGISFENYTYADILGQYYAETKDIVSAEKYYLLGFNNGIVDCLINLLYTFINIKDYSNVYKYCTYGLNTLPNNIDILNISLEYFIFKKDNECVKETILKLIKHEKYSENCIDIVEDLKKEYTVLEIYLILNDLKNKDEEIETLLSFITDDVNVKNYANKIKYFTKIKNYAECIVCYKNEIHITFECCHHVCYKCFSRMKKCQFNCVSELEEFRSQLSNYIQLRDHMNNS